MSGSGIAVALLRSSIIHPGDTKTKLAGIDVVGSETQLSIEGVQSGGPEPDGIPGHELQNV